MFGTPNFNRRSRFLDDVPEHLIEPMGSFGFTPVGVQRQVFQERTGSYNVVERRPEPVAEKKSAWKPPFDVGQRVKHAKFGIGVVVACNPVKDDVEVTVAFPGVTGVKKLAQKFAKLESI
jgi:DNA helicase-2/ATP-dependent DNA helicase PcrA